jgi:hypothetical protein
MSVFKTSLDAHEKRMANARAAAETAAAAKQEAEVTFLNDFQQAVLQTAKPIFDEIALDAQRANYPAKVRWGQDEKGRSALEFKFVPREGASLPANKSDIECVFVLVGDLEMQKVEYIGRFDPRLGQKGERKCAYGVTSIKRQILEREFGEFFKKALAVDC